MPNEIEVLVRKLWEIQRPNFPDDSTWEEVYSQSHDWEARKNVEEGVALLESRIASLSGENPQSTEVPPPK